VHGQIPPSCGIKIIEVKKMNKKYVEYLQDMITEKLQDTKVDLSTEQIKKLLEVSGELKIMKDELYP